jgi:hypothetical protein
MIESTREEMTMQTFSAIAMSNRLTVAKIRLKRNDRLSESFDSEMKEIRDSILELTDLLLLGEDVRSKLNMINEQIEQFERRIAIE